MSAMISPRPCQESILPEARKVFAAAPDRVFEGVGDRVIETTAAGAACPAAAVGGISPDRETKKENAPWRGRVEEPVFKPEDFPSLPPTSQAFEDFPSLNQPTTPRRSNSRGRGQMTPRRVRVCGTISEGKPQVHGCIPEDKPTRTWVNQGARMGHSISEDQLPKWRGLNNKAMASPQRQRPQLADAWQQRQTRTAKSVEPEPRKTPAPRAASESPETRQTPRPLPAKEIAADAPKEQMGESLPTARQTSEQRCHSEPVTPAVSQEGIAAAAAQAAKIAQAHGDLNSTLHGMLKVVDQVKAAGSCRSRKAVLLASFESEHAKMLKLMQSLQTAGTANKDPSALLALNLLLVAGQVNAPGNTMTGAATPTMEPKPVGLQWEAEIRSRFPSTSTRSCGFVPLFVPQSQYSNIPGGPMQVVPNMWVPTGVPMAPSVNDYRTPLQAPKDKARRLREYTVINPSTGEKMKIRTRVPFRWKPRGACRLRIIDPKTGLEVIDPKTGLRVLGPANDEVGAEPRASVASSRLSNGTRCSTGSAPRRSVTPSARHRRSSIAGNAHFNGTTWTLEKHLGGHWDWPLSRQEKKDRILMLQQLELLEEIEELHAAAAGAEQECAWSPA